MANAAPKIATSGPIKGLRRSLRKPTVAKRLDMPVPNWPGGRGHEIGTVCASLAEIEDRIEHNSSDKLVRMISVTEDGVQAIMLIDLVQGPISFLAEPEMSKDTLAVIAGIALNPDDVWAALMPFLGELKASRG